MDLARQVDVVGIATLSLNELGVLGSLHRLAYAEFGRGQSGFGRPVVHAEMLSECAERNRAEIEHVARLHKNGQRGQGLRRVPTLLDFSSIKQQCRTRERRAALGGGRKVLNR
jgi:hypothetical protein